MDERDQRQDQDGAEDDVVEEDLRRIEAIEDRGITILPGNAFMEGYTPAAGQLGGRAPTGREQADRSRMGRMRRMWRMWMWAPRRARWPPAADSTREP